MILPTTSGPCEQILRAIIEKSKDAPEIATRWKDFFEIVSYAAAIPAAVWALVTYHKNSRRERATWAVQLYEKFFESDRHKEIREKLDKDTETYEIRKLVNDESPAFTDYLNFFELVVILANDKQLSRGGVRDLFDYYLRCLSKHESVRDYIYKPSKGFQHLSKFLKALDT